MQRTVAGVHSLWKGLEPFQNGLADLVLMIVELDLISLQLLDQLMQQSAAQAVPQFSSLLDSAVWSIQHHIVSLQGDTKGPLLLATAHALQGSRMLQYQQLRTAHAVLVLGSSHARAAAAPAGGKQVH